jgi:uncharacterized membrane protein YagU involved in acid resistance
VIRPAEIADETANVPPDAVGFSNPRLACAVSEGADRVLSWFYRAPTGWAGFGDWVAEFMDIASGTAHGRARRGGKDRRMNTTNRALLGALAGAAGGLAMTLMIQKVAPKVLPEEMRPGGFAPKKAVQWTEEKAGQPEALSEGEEMKAAMGAHLGYSAMGGAMYGIARESVRGIPAPLSGAVFGLALWGLSFEGWMPALGIMERTTDKPIKKWPAPIMGHLIYGVVTALSFEGLEALRERSREGAHTKFEGSSRDESEAERVATARLASS